MNLQNQGQIDQAQARTFSLLQLEQKVVEVEPSLSELLMGICCQSLQREIYFTLVVQLKQQVEELVSIAMVSQLALVVQRMLQVLTFLVLLSSHLLELLL